MKSNQHNGCIVVGSIYKSFADGQNVFDEIDIIQQLRRGEVKHDFIILGQGLARQSIIEIMELVKIEGIECDTDLLDMASTDLTHKAELENVLITKPVECGDRMYKFNLVIGDNFDRLSDHVTGEHVGAMILIEAARQSAISVLEQEYRKLGGISYGYNLHKLNTQYYQYAFPVPTSIYVKLEKDRGQSQSQSQRETELVARFYQNDFCVSEMVMEVGLIENKLLKRIENRSSKKIGSMLINKYSGVGSDRKYEQETIC